MESGVGYEPRSVGNDAKTLVLNNLYATVVSFCGESPSREAVG